MCENKINNHNKNCVQMGEMIMFRSFASELRVDLEEVDTTT